MKSPRLSPQPSTPVTDHHRSRAAAWLALLAVALLWMVPAGAETVRTLEQSFTPDDEGVVRIANLAGKMTLLSGSGDEVRVKATLHAEDEDLLDEMKWVRDRDRGGWALYYPVDNVRYPVEAQRSSGILGWLASNVSNTNTKYLGERVQVSSGKGRILYADLEISYPAGIPLKVRQVVGDVAGSDLYGELRVDTGSGDVEIESFNGELVVDTGSGDIEVGSFRGSTGNFDTGSGDVEVSSVNADRVIVDTGSGDVLVRDGRVGDLSADTGSGDVIFDDVAVRKALMDTGSGDVRLTGSLAEAVEIVADTGSGDVEIYGDVDASFRVSADQGSGELTVGYDDAELRYTRDRRKVVGATRGDGRTVIEIDTGSGDAVVSPAR